MESDELRPPLRNLVDVFGAKIEWPEAIVIDTMPGVLSKIVAGEADMPPAQRRDMRKQLVGGRLARSA